jgi:hypothetical protein
MVKKQFLTENLADFELNQVKSVIKHSFTDFKQNPNFFNRKKKVQS